MFIAGIFACLILVNISFFLMTLCGEMGVPPSVYERYYKMKYSLKQKQEDKEDLELQEIED